MKDVKLEAGEYICKKCDGTGRQDVTINQQAFPCWTCDGAGKVDWVTHVMGPRDPIKVMFDKFRIPQIRHAYPKLIAEELCSVQPVEFKAKNENKE